MVSLPLLTPQIAQHSVPFQHPVPYQHLVSFQQSDFWSNHRQRAFYDRNYSLCYPCSILELLSLKLCVNVLPIFRVASCNLLSHMIMSLRHCLRGVTLVTWFSPRQLFIQFYERHLPARVWQYTVIEVALSKHSGRLRVVVYRRGGW
jgi:hypothetical protein